MKLISWNVNGVRAAHKKGLLDFMTQAQADVICLQEAKAHSGDVQHIAWPHGYEVFWNPAVKKGYSGTAILSQSNNFTGGVQSSRINYDSIEFNRSVPDSIFAKPSNPKELKKDLKL